MLPKRFWPWQSQCPVLSLRLARLPSSRYLNSSSAAPPSTKQDTGAILPILEERGLINQIVGERDDLDKLLRGKDVGVYIGVDPTASSMHLGHLIPMMALYWMYAYGCHAYCITGSVTAMIGDPSGRTSAREKPVDSTIQRNTRRISQQLGGMFASLEDSLQRLVPTLHPMRSHSILDNLDWFSGNMLCSLAKGIKLGPMLGRDSVKQRMAEGGSMSLAEFNYPMMQAWDWWHLYVKYNVQVQIGGSDQFGNILAGADGVNYMRKNDDLEAPASQSALKARYPSAPMGFTVPLLTTAAGEKLGKSAGNAVWLDRELTPPFKLYQFFLRVPDFEVSRYLKLFTFLPLTHIQSVMEQQRKHPPLRLAQHTLAREVTALVHGLSTAEKAAAEHKLIFGRNNSEETAVVLDGPSATLPRSILPGLSCSRLLYHAGLVKSISVGRVTVTGGGAYVGSVPHVGQSRRHSLQFETLLTIEPDSKGLGKDVLKERKVDWESCIVNHDLLVLRRGKTEIKLVRLENDEDFVRSELDFPGSKHWWDNVCPTPLKEMRGERGK